MSARFFNVALLSMMVPTATFAAEATSTTAAVTASSSAGNVVGDLHANAVNQAKVFWAEDPDGYKYEITEVAVARP